MFESRSEVTENGFMRAKDWREIVRNPDEIRVFEALDEPETTWRTAWGVAWDTGLPEDRVWEMLAKYIPTLIRFSTVPSVSGKPFIGLAEKVLMD